jgi:glycosyltransferase involved in cell wall biosynthesis
LLQRGFPQQKLALIPNGSNVRQFHPDPEAGARLRAELGLEDEFLVLYAGNHGIAQGLDTIVEVARRLRDQADIRLVLVGAGPEKRMLVAMRDEHELSNLDFLDERPTAEIPAFLSAADAALVPLRKRDLFLDVVPSKMYDAWACACPTIVSVDGEARRILEDARAGLYAEPDNPDDIARAIIELRDNPDRAAELGRNARAYVVQHHSREAMARRLEAILQRIVNGDLEMRDGDAAP